MVSSPESHQHCQPVVQSNPSDVSATQVPDLQHSVENSALDLLSQPVQVESTVPYSHGAQDIPATYVKQIQSGEFLI